MVLTHMESSHDKRKRVTTVETTFDILETLQAFEGATLSELALEHDLAKSTIHRHLSTLCNLGYVVRDGSVYRLGLEFLNLGNHVQYQFPEYRLAEPKVEELASETGERAQFVVEEHGECVYLHIAHGQHAVRTDPGIGRRVGMHVASAGKAILAHLPKERVHQIIADHGLPALTDSSITDPDEFWAELKKTREQGYGFNDQESLEGLRAVGVPVCPPEKGVIGALSLSGPTHRLKGDYYREELPDLLLGMANELELNIAYS